MSNSLALSYRTLRALGFSPVVNLGFRFAPPQALCFHPLRGFREARPHKLYRRRKWPCQRIIITCSCDTRCWLYLRFTPSTVSDFEFNSLFLQLEISNPKRRDAEVTETTQRKMKLAPLTFPCPFPLICVSFTSGFSSRTLTCNSISESYPRPESLPMKRCPKCDFSFANFYHVCDFDGTDLVDDPETLPVSPGVSALVAATQSPFLRLIKSPVFFAVLGLAGVLSSLLLIVYYDATVQPNSIAESRASRDSPPNYMASPVPPTQPPARPSAPIGTRAPSTSPNEVSTESGSDRVTILTVSIFAIGLDPVATALGTDSITINPTWQCLCPQSR